MSKARIEVPAELQTYLEVEHCDDFPVNRYHMTDDVQELYDRIIDNYNLSPQIHAYGFNYLNTALLYGLPGTGKTHFSRYVAHMQDLDFAYINFAKMMGGYGDANKIISDIFRFMANTKCVFMMDEIDCIARKRSKDGSDVAITMAGNTITVMQELDYYRSHDVNSIILAATNRVDTLDEALLSRFALKHEMQPLSNLDKEKYLIHCLEDAGIPFKEEDIQHYCARNSRLEQRNMELDMIQGIATWIKNGKQGTVQIEHIK